MQIFNPSNSLKISLLLAISASAIILYTIGLPSKNSLLKSDKITCTHYQAVYSSPGDACCSYDLSSHSADENICTTDPEPVDLSKVKGGPLDFSYDDQISSNKLLKISLKIKKRYQDILIYGRNSNFKDGNQSSLNPDPNAIFNGAAELKSREWYLLSKLSPPKDSTRKKIRISDGFKVFKSRKKKRKVEFAIKTDLAIAGSQEYLIYAIKKSNKSKKQLSTAPDYGYFYVGETPVLNKFDEDGDGYCAVGADSSCDGLSTDCDDKNALRWQNLPYYFRDNDGDNAYIRSAGSICSGTSLPSGFAERYNGEIDCNDDDSSLNMLQQAFLDADGDSYTMDTPAFLCVAKVPPNYKAIPSVKPDCNDADPILWQNLTGYLDLDNDNYTTGEIQTVCSGASLPAGYKTSISSNNDCDDSDNTIWQNSTFYSDQDNDGVTAGSAVTLCTGSTTPTGYKSTASAPQDCAPTDSSKWRELAYTFRDADGDSHFIPSAGTQCSGSSLPKGYATTASPNTDCNDTNKLVWKMLAGYADSDNDNYTTGGIQNICSGNSLPTNYKANKASGQTADDCAPTDANKMLLLRGAGDLDQDDSWAYYSNSCLHQKYLAHDYFELNYTEENFLIDFQDTIDCDDNNPALKTGASCNIIGKRDTPTCPYSQYQNSNSIIIDNSNSCGTCFNYYAEGITYGLTAPLCNITQLASSNFNSAYANKTIYIRNGATGIYRLKDPLILSNPSTNFTATGNIKITAFPNEKPRILYSQAVKNWTLSQGSTDIYELNWLNFIRDFVDLPNSTYYQNKFKTETDAVPIDGSDRIQFYLGRLTPQIVAIDSSTPFSFTPINPFKQLPASNWGFSASQKTYYKDKLNNNIIERIDQADLEPGTFYYEAQPDHPNFGKIYIKLPITVSSNPNSLNIEVSFVEGLILERVKNLEISNLSFNYANARGNHMHGLGIIRSENIILDNLNLSHNSFSPISGSCSNCTIKNSKLNWGLNNGGGLIGENTKYLNNEIAYNNYVNYFWGWHGGGLKLIAYIKNMQVSNNYVHHNEGPGIWFDTMKGGHTITNNIVTDNLGAGIEIEITNYNAPGAQGTDLLEEGGDIIIRNNLLIKNENQGFSPNGSGIFISSSSNILAEKNIIIDSPTGVLMNGIYRGDTFQPARKILKNNRILNNIIIDTNFPLSYYLGNDSPLGIKVPTQYSTGGQPDSSFGVNVANITSDYNLMYGKSQSPLFNCAPNCPKDVIPGTSTPFFPYNDGWPNSMSFLGHWSQSIYSGYGWPSIKVWRAVSGFDRNSKAIVVEDPNVSAGWSYVGAPPEFQGFKLELVNKNTTTTNLIDSKINAILAKPLSDSSRYSGLTTLHQELYNEINRLPGN